MVSMVAARAFNLVEVMYPGRLRKTMKDQPSLSA